MFKRKHRFYYTFWICIFAGPLFQVNESRRCQKYGRNICCSHFYENHEKECIACMTGYMSKNGSLCFKCPQPYYGHHCIKKCSCNDEQTCDHEKGCLFKRDEESSSKEEEGAQSNKSSSAKISDKSKSEMWPMILSSSIAAMSFLAVMVIVVIKCKSWMFGTKSALDAMCKHDKDKTNERKTNVYGTYQLKRLGTEVDEYEFDSDNEDDEDPYAVIRDSQVLPQTTDIETDDNFDQYTTYGYNHLHLMGFPRPAGFQKKIKGSDSSAVYGIQFSTFQDHQI